MARAEGRAVASRTCMAELIAPERIIPMLLGSNKHKVIEKLSWFAAAHAGLDKKLVQKAVIAREGLTTFGVGRGIAIPHAAVPGISKPLGAFARLKHPVDFGAADGRLADLVFLLLTPEDDPGALLPALSCVARRLRDREVARRLRAESSAEVSHVLLTSDSWRGHDPDPDWKRAA
jgi:PTS system nitrogen regulatory IIA component